MLLQYNNSMYTIFIAIMFIAVNSITCLLHARFDQPDSKLKHVIPVVIIGSGPAGLNAAVYTARSGCSTIVFTGPEPGGSLTQAHYVENWPARTKTTGANIMEDMQKEATSFGALLIPKSIVKVDFSLWPHTLWTDDDDEIHALAVIIATGGTAKTLDIPGVKQYWGKGISICAICDAHFDKDKEVAVIGGGDVGIDKALQLAKFAKKVTNLEKEPH